MVMIKVFKNAGGLNVMFRATKEQGEFIRSEAKGKTTLELTKLFNDKFNTETLPKEIRAYKQRYKIKSGVSTRFKAGNVPYNKGKKGLGGYEPTQFKKGMVPLNKREVGSERINVDGYVEIKIAEPNLWRAKHKVIWENKYGKIPEEHVLLFADGNKLNLNLDNLLLITRRQLLVMNRKKLIQNDIELTKSGVIIADVLIKMADRLKNKKQSDIKAVNK